MNFQVHYSCSQCGAPFSFAEGERILFCPYCRVKSLIVGEKYLHYFLPPKNNLEECIFVPYFRIQGGLFFTTLSKVIPFYLDTTLVAINQDSFPLSLGLRAQAMPLKLVYQENLTLIQKELNFSKALGQIKKRLAKIKLKTTSYYQDFLGENLSFIYLPILPQNNYYLDALTKRPLTPIVENNKNFNTTSKENWNLNFLPALCPKCGDTLQGEKKDLLLICENCKSFYYFESEKLEEIKPRLLFYSEDVLYLPFWQFQIELSSNFKSLVQYLYSLYLIKEDNLTLTIPGFQMRPDHFLRFATAGLLSSKLKTSTPFDLSKRLTFLASNFSRKEAITSIRIILANLIKSREIIKSLTNLKFKIKNYQLTYIPFIQNHIEIIQPHLNLAINKNCFSFFV